MKRPKHHSYSDLNAFERLMLLIATLVKYPRVGFLHWSEFENKGYNSTAEVKQYLQNLAKELKIELPANYPAIATIRKDFEILRKYGILDERMYRWGYYLGTGVLTEEELRIAYNALESLAINQGHPRIRQIYANLTRKLRGFQLSNHTDFFYPVRQQLNKAINYTDPEEMLEKGEHRNTLYHHLETIETAIIEGQAIEISRREDPYQEKGLGMQIVWPLQLIYHDIAWYLLYESCSDGCLAMGRINRFGNYCQIITQKGRGIEAQKQSLEDAKKLLNDGWGLFLGNKEEQNQELNAKLELVPIKVRFFPPVNYFIAEGERRHPKQKLIPGKIDASTGKPAYLDYQINLPPRSLNEFSIWVQKYADKAQVISPPELVQKHYQTTLALIERYQSRKENIT